MAHHAHEHPDRHDHPAPPAVDPDTDPATFWEDRYAGSEKVWSGRVNATTADVVATLPRPDGGTAVDLGCGEGGDAVWLAEQGWRVTAVDLSPTAVARGAAGAQDRGVADRTTWVAHDLATWDGPGEEVDLVTASFLHSPVALERGAIVRRAAGWVRPGGHLLLVTHVFESADDMPPWTGAGEDGERLEIPEMPPPSVELPQLGLDLDAWEVVTAEVRRREASDPRGSGSVFPVKDGVLLLRRR
ncbi:class I SAM-dependent methyltransferase [Lapillicoccus jejuensis]|uniref:Methyltransferase family protein n=1 Tax=Lapillicoccus jejuensis TaxID=402171 RepID=A0A542DZ97_9MICO|nr:class I SAM-dependent methyltransferase [Lapillicoccus jejuensis]TQJ08421.1 methyltransferase family protein [Lapillicoccus jejuensis]